MPTRRLFPWLFVLTLLFGQAAAFAHSLNHLDPHDSALPDKVCEVCLAQASLGSAAPQKGFSLPCPPAGLIVLPEAGVSLVSVTIHAAHARAPPVTA